MNCSAESKRRQNYLINVVFNMKKLFLLSLLVFALTGCMPNKQLTKTVDELTQRFAGKKYSIEPIKGEDEQYLVRIFNTDVKKRRLNRQIAMSEICPYSKFAEVLAEKEDHKHGKTQLVVWCRPK